jgi:hypothetical protein
MGKTVWSLVKLLIGFVLVWYCFQYFLGFNERQSIVFALLVVGGFNGLRSLAVSANRAREFTPYTVSIRVQNARDLLFDYKFLRTDEEWKNLCEKATDASVLRRGINFTVLTVDSYGLPKLIFWDDHKRFISGIPQFPEPIREIQFKREDGLSSCDWSPRLYFGHKTGKGKGYSLGLIVPEGWWKKVADGALANSDILTEHHVSDTYLFLATIPYGEIGLNYKQRKQDRKKELSDRGWTLEDFHEPGLRRLDEFRIEQKYFSVSQRFCETD